MAKNDNHNRVNVLVIGAGPAGLSCAIRVKAQHPDMEVCVIEKAPEPGNHNLSGAVLESGPLEALLDFAVDNRRQRDDIKEVLSNRISRDNVMFFAGRHLSFNILFSIKLASFFGIGFGQMKHDGDYVVSISRLTRLLGDIAEELGVEVLTGFAAEDINLDDSGKSVTSVKLVDQGRDREGEKQPNFVPGEKVEADFFVLAEGCDGLLTEKFITKAGLKRQCPQLYSVGVKELIKVSDRQYENFGRGRVVHALGYPLWRPVMGPDMFGGGIMYPGEANHISVGIIVGADWKYRDFNPQDALTLFKRHRFVRKFIEGGAVVEAGAKMIPEGGFDSIPRSAEHGTIGKGNCLILGDSAGFVNMLKIKGLHIAIDSGVKAGRSIAEKPNQPDDSARRYTELVDNSSIYKEMYSARNFRQTVARFGPLFGMPLSALGGLLPKFKPEPDYETMKKRDYSLKPRLNYDKDTFTAMAATEHREEQPSHLTINDTNVCREECEPAFHRPCITFCPAGVYETIHDEVKPANSSNCVHCKTCQRKCPFDNIRWTVPEGGGGPRYKRL